MVYDYINRRLKCKKVYKVNVNKVDVNNVDANKFNFKY